MTSRAFDLRHGYAAIRDATMSGIRKELAAGVNINDNRFRGEADMHGHVGLSASVAIDP